MTSTVFKLKSRTSLRVFFTCAFLACAFVAGWFTHDAWNNRNLDRALLTAYSKIQSPATISVNKDLGLVKIKGTKAAVEQTTAIIEEVQKALKK